MLFVKTGWCRGHRLLSLQQWSTANEGCLKRQKLSWTLETRSPEDQESRGGFPRGRAETLQACPQLRVVHEPPSGFPGWQSLTPPLTGHSSRASVRVQKPPLRQDTRHDGVGPPRTHDLV